MTLFKSLLAALAAAVLPVSVAAAPISPATCATLAALVTIGTPGGTIALTGTCATPIAIVGRHFAPPLTIDATHATFTAPLTLRQVDGLTIDRGTFGPIPYHGGYGITVTASKHVSLTHGSYAHLDRAIVIGGGSSLVYVGYNRITALRIDGVDVAWSSFVTLKGNSVADPEEQGLEHPDCYQAWSRPGQPVADLTIIGNSCSGPIQGISLFNHVRPDVTGKMVDDGGFDRVKITGNTVAVTLSNGITVDACRMCVVTGNRVPSTDRHLNRITINTPVGWTAGANDVSALPAITAKP